MIINKLSDKDLVDIYIAALKVDKIERLKILLNF